MTRDELDVLEHVVRAAEHCAPRDFARFAELLRDDFPALAETVRCHAAAADSNSPDVVAWIVRTMQDYSDLVTAGITKGDVDAAENWWLLRYASE